MNKKRKNIVMIIILILIIILTLWITGIIPKKIAEIYGTYYLNKNFPKMQLEFERIEWSSSFGDYIITFKDENNEQYGFVIGPKYFPVSFGQSMFGFEENYREKYSEQNEYTNMSTTMKAVVIKVKENSLMVMGFDNIGLCSVSFAEEGNIGFKQGQEILIYFDGMIAASYPGQIYNVGKIEIIKEKSDIEIPKSILRYSYSSRNNVTVSISELTKTGIKFTIKDTNELQYDYSNTYTIYKKVKNKDYTGIGYQIGENTGNSTAGFTGTGLEYIWEEAPKLTNVSSEDTVIVDNKEKIIEKRCDWTNLYGELKDGEYEFVLSASDFSIRIKFNINANGEISYNKAELL